MAHLVRYSSMMYDDLAKKHVHCPVRKVLNYCTLPVEEAPWKVHQFGFKSPKPRATSDQNWLDWLSSAGGKD